MNGPGRYVCPRDGSYEIMFCDPVMIWCGKCGGQLKFDRPLNREEERELKRDIRSGGALVP